MDVNEFRSSDPIAWCPGCGNFGLLKAVQKALEKLGISPSHILLVSGIGQAAKLPHYIKANCFNGLHGRALPVAAAAKMANKKLTVLVTTGDGDCYGEGGNHFVHNIRRNVDITVIVHNNQIYGLTKGQASPTSDQGLVTKVQTHGVILERFNPLELAVSLGAGFVARGFVSKTDHLADLIVEGLKHNGFSLIDVLQPCVSFNRKNTYRWYSERVYDISEHDSYDPYDKMSAYRKAGEWEDRIPIGIIYKKDKASYHERSGLEKRIAPAEEHIGEVDINGVLQDYLA
jgi:2-oxoglutarate ferredoxin oxidoreductase subunit beta